MSMGRITDVYLISGLGADSRAFRNLRFGRDLSVHHLDWIPPHRDEPMNAYARRLAAGINQERSFAIIGLSFGAMLASEMKTFLSPGQVILVSGVNNHRELPLLYRVGGRSIHRLLPSKPVGRKMLLAYLFGVHTEKDKALLQDVVRNTDPVFSRWAINAIVNWSRHDEDPGVIRIHGDKDRVLPITTFKPAHVIRGGGHLMVIDRAAELSEIIAGVLNG